MGYSHQLNQIVEKRKKGRNTNLSTRLHLNTKASIGVGSLIVFIAMILVAGIAASIIIQTMNTLQQQAMNTGRETLRDIAGGIEVTHVSGYISNSKITQLAIFITPIVASEDIDLTYTYISLSDSTKKVILNYDNTCFSSSVSNGLFGTLNASNLTATEYGIMVIRDIDGSCTASSPTINENDLVVLLVNTTQCFSGINTRTDVFGTVNPEYGVTGVISFTTPTAFVETIVDLQP
ncbi:MAG TPA: flagellin [Thermoplasmatales archaeon]|nr:flagellin [Thermoplasmatales archaeon]